MKLNIVLVEPEIPSNTGNISRTCAITNAALHLVHPLGFDISEKQVRRAGLDYWSSLELYEYNSFSEVREKYKDDMFFYASTKAKRIYSDVDFKKSIKIDKKNQTDKKEKEIFLVFGKETKGLPEELLYENYKDSIRIPMGNGMRSLNLSNSVAIAVYEVLRQWDYPALQNEGQLHNYKWEDV